MKVILISGHAQHGKDTTGEILKERLEQDRHSVRITHFAGILKYICKEFFGWDGQKDERGRAMLQNIGTDVVRRKDPDFWIRFLTQVLTMFQDYWEYVIIPDTRFPNEITGMINAGFDVCHLRVFRYGEANTLTKAQLNHPSETSLDNVAPDYLIDNTKGLPELRQAINEFVEDFLYENKA
ncbi:MAG: hypothetical protein LUD69_04735 [Oscillospiraceae bacterium]|nr:hypothetical protein [Oscillospiraceae bacterium]